MTTWQHMTELIQSIPDLPGARCVGKANLFEATVVQLRDPRPRSDVEAARTAALRLCTTCPALAACRAWINELPPPRRPIGVVAGQFVISDGSIARSGWPSSARPEPPPRDARTHGETRP